VKALVVIALTIGILAVTGCDSGVYAPKPATPEVTSPETVASTPPPSNWNLSSETNPVSGVVTTVANW